MCEKTKTILSPVFINCDQYEEKKIKGCDFEYISIEEFMGLNVKQDEMLNSSLE